ncbi:hypothetical protein DKX38_008652 [Salix brachista]|uniref:Uncharacterized protein n=1 Tax=Salix brachista TaxID=2182728 RepID=A0A5N5MT10_9ROSI|nr:hypothetical protein DKX38_008652 [Salix brachista]
MEITIKASTSISFERPPPILWSLKLELRALYREMKSGFLMKVEGCFPVSFGGLRGRVFCEESSETTLFAFSEGSWEAPLTRGQGYTQRTRARAKNRTSQTSTLFLWLCKSLHRCLLLELKEEIKEWEIEAKRKTIKMITRSNLVDQLREYQIRSKHDWASVSFFSSTSNLSSSRYVLLAIPFLKFSISKFEHHGISLPDEEACLLVYEKIRGVAQVEFHASDFWDEMLSSKFGSNEAMGFVVQNKILELNDIDSDLVSSLCPVYACRVDVVLFVIWELFIIAFLVFSAVSLYFRHMQLAFILVCITLLLLLCMKVTKQVRLARKKKRRMLLPLSM